MNVFDRLNIALSGAGGGVDVERARVAIVSALYFNVFRVAPVIGRAFTEEEDRGWGAHPLTVISDAYWQRRLGRASDVIGRTLTLNGTAFAVVGVMPPGFSGEWISRPIDLWVPFTMHPQVLIEEPGPLIAGNANWLHIFGRLKPGVTLKQAAAEVQTVDQRALRDFAGAAATPDAISRLAQVRMDLEPGGRGYSLQRERLIEPLTILVVVVALVLLVACTNVASLVLARAAHRRRELAVRLAIGAGAARIARQALTEGLLLSVVAGALGLVMAAWGASMLGVNMVAGPVDMFSPGGVRRGSRSTRTSAAPPCCSPRCWRWRRACCSASHLWRLRDRRRLPRSSDGGWRPTPGGASVSARRWSRRRWRCR